MKKMIALMEKMLEVGIDKSRSSGVKGGRWGRSSFPIMGWGDERVRETSPFPVREEIGEGELVHP